MEFRKEGDTFIIRLARGEKLLESLTAFLERTGIRGGKLQAIGAVDELTLGFYHVDSKSYDWKTFREDLEVASLLGTVSETGLHAHGVFSNSKFEAFGGHVKEARVSGTLEIFLREHKKLRRKEDPVTGIKVLEI